MDLMANKYSSWDVIDHDYSACMKKGAGFPAPVTSSEYKA